MHYPNSLGYLYSSSYFDMSMKNPICKNIPYSTLSSPPLNDRHFAKLGGGLDKGDLFLPNLYKNFEKN